MTISYLSIWMMYVLDRVSNKRTISGTITLDRITTQSMSKICNLWHLIVVDCDYAESYKRFLSRGSADASHAVYIVPDDS